MKKKQEKFVFDNNTTKQNEFLNFIKKTDNTKLLYSYITSEKFNNQINEILLENHIDLGISKALKKKSLKKKY